MQSPILCSERQSRCCGAIATPATLREGERLFNFVGFWDRALTAEGSGYAAVVWDSKVVARASERPLALFLSAIS
jgi:hypothetical protein